MKKLIIVMAVGLGLLIGIALIASIFISFVAFDFPGFSQGIAVIPVKGEIMMESGSFSYEMTAMEIVESIERAEEDPTVGAILLEINSGGGGVVASREIAKKVREARQTKPVVAWISEVGASGAYYVASASDHVVADPDSITGSIGVISVFPNIEGLLEKLGIEITD